MLKLLPPQKMFFRLWLIVAILFGIVAVSNGQTIINFTNENPSCGKSDIGFFSTVSGVSLSKCKFKWDFGDGGTANIQNPRHVFNVAPGAMHMVNGIEVPFTVKLVVHNDSLNKSDTITQLVTVRPAVDPILLDVDRTSSFSNCAHSPSVSNPDFAVALFFKISNIDSVKKYTIDWGDGLTDAFLKGKLPTRTNHIYKILGVFKLRLTTFGDNDCETTKEYEVVNQSNPALGVTNHGSTSGCAPVSFSFTLNEAIKNDSKTIYLIDFGDGKKTTWTQDSVLKNNSSITHEYTTSSCNQPKGVFTLSVIARNGCTDTPSTSGAINVKQSPVPLFTVKDLCDGTTFQFTNTTQLSCSSSSSETYIWNYGDGIIDTLRTSISVVHKYKKDKPQYYATLTIINECDQSKTSDPQLVLLPVTPIADFQLSTTKDCLSASSSLIVKATDNTTTFNQALSYYWTISPTTGTSFAPGGQYIANPQITFTKRGVYYLTLNASNHCPMTGVKTKTITVLDKPTATLGPISKKCISYIFDASQPTVFKIDSLPTENVSAKWTITPKNGWSYISPYDSLSMAPKIKFSASGDYTIKVDLKNDCGTTTRLTPLHIDDSTHNVTTASDSIGCLQKIIAFKDYSTGSITSHNWSVTPNGSSFSVGNSTSKDVSIKFTSAGTYTVKHIVYGDCGSETKSFVIKIYTKPQISLLLAASQCNIPFNLKVDSNTFKIINSNGGIKSYLWTITPSTGVTFEDTTSSTSKYPSLKFANYGQYTVSVKATNSCDNYTATQTISILEPPLEKATFWTDDNCNSLSIIFTDKSTGNQLSHQWSANPNTNCTINSSTSASPNIFFNKPGIYTVTHKISNSCGSSQHDYVFKVKGNPIVTMKNIPPTCDHVIIDASDPQYFTVNENYNDTVKYLWDIKPIDSVKFLNGTTVTSKYPKFQFIGTGSIQYGVTMSVPCAGKMNSTAFFTSINIWPPTISSTIASKTEGCAPETIDFKDLSIAPTLTHKWTVTPSSGTSFVTGTSLSKDVSIKFSLPGVYIVEHKVQGVCGAVSKTFTITITAKPQITFSLADSNQCAIPYNLNIDPTSFKIANNGGVIKSFKWSVTPSDGVTFEDTTSLSSKYPHFTFTKYGKYLMKVKIENNCNTDSLSQFFSISEPAIEKAAPSVIDGCFPLPVTFTDKSTGTQLTHLWTITPSASCTITSSSAASPLITFTKAGIYTVTHKITNTCGSSQHDYIIRVKGNPNLTLKAFPNTCTKVIFDASDPQYFSYTANPNDTLLLRWSITPIDSVIFLNGTTIDSQFPKFQFIGTGPINYSVLANYYCGGKKMDGGGAFGTINIYARSVLAATASKTQGCINETIDFKDQTIGSALNYDWTVTPWAGVTYAAGNNASKNVSFKFTKTGVFSVIHTINDGCGTSSKTFTITITEKPQITFSNSGNQCTIPFNLNVDLNKFKIINNGGGIRSFKWSVTPSFGVTCEDTTSLSSKYPHLKFTRPGQYTVSVKAENNCDSTKVSQTFTIQEPTVENAQPSEIKGCAPLKVDFVDQSSGGLLTHLWTVSPTTNRTISDATIVSPSITFSKAGIYTVTHKITNFCGSSQHDYIIEVNEAPTVVFGSIPDTCDSYTFKSDRYVTINDNGTAIKSYNWTIVPNTGFVFISGDKSSAHPQIQFTDAGSYVISLDVTNDCGVTTKSSSFKIDEFVQAKVGADSTFCKTTDPIQLSGTPSGGVWKILPSGSSTLLKTVGAVTYFDPSVAGVYKLTYHYGSTYCSSEANRQFTVVDLPNVDAGRDFKTCLNETNTVPLNGLPVGGTWSGSGIINNTFKTNGLTVGPYILKYTYTDPVTLCQNTDQLIATIVNVPVTGFNSVQQGCKNVPITFNPYGPPNSTFSWDFGDGQTAISTGPINHTFLKGGTYTVNLNSADQNSCSLNMSQTITVQDDIIMPVVNYASNGCGPYTVKFTIDTTGTTLNGQTHKWDFGNGTVVNNVITEKEITYYPGIADTIYTAKLTVSNSCFTKTNSYPVTVKVKPHVNFTFPIPWMCTPATVKFRNLTGDRKASFYWDFDDGTTSTEFEPTHTFLAPKMSKAFNVKLVAINSCGKDSMTRIFLVKPNSLEAYIEMSSNKACPRDLVSFKNLSTDTLSTISSNYWDFGDGTIVNTWNATHAYTNTGKYTVKLFIDNGCSQAETTAQVEILPVPDLNIHSLDSVCKNDTLQLAGSSNGNSLINAKWDFGEGTYGTGLTTSHVFTSSGWVTVTFTAASAGSLVKCDGLKTKKIFIKDAPPQLFLPDQAGCSPFTITVPSPGGPYTYLMNYGDDKNWTALNTHTYVNSGSQSLRKRVTILSENNLLCRTQSYFWVTIHPNPVARISVRSVGGYPEVVYFKNSSQNASVCEWIFQDGSSMYSCDSVVKSFYTNGSTKVFLKTTNQYGCTDTTSLNYLTLIKGLHVPNALQPSNSDPLVRIFKPAGIGLKTYRLGIYDLWGNLIWETEKINNNETVEGWNGKDKTGKELQQGVYIWRISATFIDDSVWMGDKGTGSKEKTEGTVTLIR